MASTATSTAMFHQNFWGEENAGFDVLMQNMKAGISASKELGEYIKERAVTEDSYVKGLTKLQKSVHHIPGSTLGAFGPLWEVLKTMCEKLVSVHSHFVKWLTELSREISDYHHTHKDKYKSNVKGEIELTQESLTMYQNTESAVHRSRKQYQQCVDHYAKVKGKLDRVKVESPSNPKLLGLENRVRQEQVVMELSKTDYQGSVGKHCDQLMEFQGKMSEACVKFESLEEEHLAQMFTFMIKFARGQDNMHVGVAELFSTLNSQLDVLTVENLLKTFVQDKGTGTVKPGPHKFKAIPVVIPPISTLNASTEDLTAPGTERRSSKTTEKKSKNRFKKKQKAPASNGTLEKPASTEPPAANPPEVLVDEEGYSIRPDDVTNAKASRRDSFDSDSDFDEEPENKIRNIKIKESSDQPVASVDDIKASVMGLRLGTISPLGMKKATSSQSLNTIGTPPSGQRKMSAATSSQNLKGVATTSPQPGGISLIDIDLMLSNAPAPQMPDPLLPVAPKGDIAKIPTPLLPTTSNSSIRDKGSQIPVPLVPSAVPLQVESTTAHLPLGFDPRTIDSTASLPVWNLSTASNPGPSPSSSPSIPRPRAGSLKGVDITEPPPAAVGAIPAPPLPTKKRASLATVISISSSVSSPSSSTERDLVSWGESNSSIKVSKSLDSSPVFGRKDRGHSPPSSSSQDAESPPVPSPRGASLLHSSSLLSPTSTLTATPISPLATAQVGAPLGSAGTDKVMPLAIAIHETCNALFKGTSVGNCLVKVEGEVVMSFPAAFLPILSSYKPLSFNINAGEKIERVLHNQYLLNKQEGDDGARYVFDMGSLATHLKKMQDKASAPFYNLQVLKYNVIIEDGSKLPLQMVSYMKCEPSITNFRLDYTYQPRVFQSSPTLCKVSVSVPIDGGVKNSLTKPVGKWSAETSHMTWMIGDIPPSENPVPTPLHAKFDLTSGPSTPSNAVASFQCEGATLSGLSLNLLSSAYRVSLLKKKCSSGKYIAEPKSTT